MRNPYHKPRAAHCIGCGVTFDKMHLMIQHRRRERCGGRFMCLDERELVDAAKKHWQKYLVLGESKLELIQDQARWHYHQWKDMLSRFYILRKRRLDESSHQ